MNGTSDECYLRCLRKVFKKYSTKIIYLKHYLPKTLFTEKQIGILKGMLFGAFIALCLVGLAFYLNPTIIEYL